MDYRRIAIMMMLVVPLLAKPVPQTSTRDTSWGISTNDIESIILHLADEAPGSNNKSHNTSTNTSCCSSDPKGSSNSSSNKSSNRSVNFDDFRENNGARKGGPTADTIIALHRFLAARGINFKVRQPSRK